MATATTMTATIKGADTIAADTVANPLFAGLTV